MSEQLKNYTPETKELFPGFECEALIATAKSIKSVKTRWEKIVIGGHSKFDHLIQGERVLKRELEAGIIRVKYLDREDIESFAWILDEEFKDGRLSFQLSKCRSKRGVLRRRSSEATLRARRHMRRSSGGG